MATDLQFRWAEPDDLPALEAFLARTYGADAVQCVPGRCRWLYFDNPLGLHVTICEDGGEIVGACGHLPKPISLGEGTVIAGFGIDFMVATSHRRRGIGRRFLDMRLERFDLSLSTGQSPGMAALYRACGGVELGSVQEAMYRRALPRPGSPRRMVRDVVLWLRSHSATAAPAGGVTATGAAPGDCSDDDTPCAWSRWRYGGDLYGGYHRWSAGDAQVIGRTDGRLLRLVEAQGVDRSALLAAVAHESTADEIHMVMAGNDLADDLRAAGFRVAPTAARVVALSRHRNLTDLLHRRRDAGGIEITAGAADADLLRLP